VRPRLIPGGVAFFAHDPRHAELLLIGDIAGYPVGNDARCIACCSAPEVIGFDR
jgi:hypothetical protein